MAENPINVLHVDAGREWRGGQQQVVYLLEGLVRRHIKTALVCQPGFPLENYCRENNLPMIPQQMTSEFDLRSAWKLARICRQKGYHILHAHCAHSLSAAILAKCFYRKVILIASRRVDFHVRKPIIGAFKYSNAFVDKIICVSDAIRHILIKDGVPAKKLTTIHSGIDLYKFDSAHPNGLREELNIPGNHLIVGTVAALADHKDYPTLLRAAHQIIKQRDNVTFIAVGDGPERESLFQLKKELNLGERFLFTGFRQDIGRFFKTFDVFVLSSKTEGLGTSVLDAQAIGCPVVATQAGGIPELVEHEKTGVLVPVQNAKALAQALLEFIDQPEKRQHLSENAITFVRQFDKSQTVKLTMNVYRECISRYFTPDSVSDDSECNSPPH